MTVWEIAFQSAPWVGLALTLYYSSSQLKAATAQARASEVQAKASEDMARLSLQQTEIMRAQIHASFRPFVIVAGGAYSLNSAVLNIRNSGTGPALGMVAIYRSGVQKSLGTLAPEQGLEFRFENQFNLMPQRIGPNHPDPEISPSERAVPLRLEYHSVSGAVCWANVRFSVGGKGEVEPDMEHGIEYSAPPMQKPAGANGPA